MNENENSQILNEISKFLTNSYSSINSITKSIIKCYYERYKYLEKELNYIEIDKPPKILKEKYKNYLKEKEELEKEKKEILKKISEEYKDLI